MRSSKNRSRSKGNRNRSVGNIVNRVFESSGPEGKVRGTPQQIIDKYNQLARDAQLSNDRVATENFQQHAEHYTRMLAEAQREMEARREQQEAQQAQAREQRQQQRQDDNQRSEGQKSDNPQNAQSRPGDGPQPDANFGEVMDGGAKSESGLVETPENGGKPKRNRRPRKSDSEAAPVSQEAASDTPPEAAE